MYAVEYGSTSLLTGVFLARLLARWLTKLIALFFFRCRVKFFWRHADLSAMAHRDAFVDLIFSSCDTLARDFKATKPKKGTLPVTVRMVPIGTDRRTSVSIAKNMCMITRCYDRGVHHVFCF